MAVTVCGPARVPARAAHQGTMRKHARLIAIIVTALFALAPIAGAFADTTTPSPLPTMAGEETPPVEGAVDRPPTVYLFWGEGCEHCDAAKAFLAELAAYYPDVTVYDVEVWNDEIGASAYADIAAVYGFEPSGVPAIIVGDQHWLGFDPVAHPAQMEDAAARFLGVENAGIYQPARTGTTSNPALVLSLSAAIIGAVVTISWVTTRRGSPR